MSLLPPDPTPLSWYLLELGSSAVSRSVAPFRSLLHWVTLSLSAPPAAAFSAAAPAVRFVFFRFGLLRVWFFSLSPSVGSAPIFGSLTYSRLPALSPSVALPPFLRFDLFPPPSLRTLFAFVLLRECMFRSPDSQPRSSKLQVWCVEPLPIRLRGPPPPLG